MDDPRLAKLRRTALQVSVLSAFLTPFMGSSMNVALPAVAREFSMTAVALGWIPMAYQLAAAVFLVPFGRLADIRGRRRVFLAGIAVFTVSSVLCAVAPSGGFLIGCRAGQGIGGAMIFGTGVAILTSVFPPGRRGKALGINTAAVYLGLSLGPVCGGFLTQSLGWRWIFWAAAPVGLAALVQGALRLKGEWAEARGESFDGAGAVLFGAALVGLMFGFSRLPAALGWAVAGAGLVLLGAFIVRESRVPQPLLGVRLFRENRTFAFSNLAAFINYSATAAVSFLLSLYLQYIKGLPPRQAGLVLIAQPVVMVVCSPWAGRLSDRTEPRLVASLGMAFTTIGLLLMAFLREATPFPFIVGGLLFLGLGFGLFSSPNTNAVMCSVTPRQYGVASAALGTMRLSGQMLSIGFAVLVIALIMGDVPIAPETFGAFLRSTRTAFLIFAVLCALGIFASLARGNRGDLGAGP